MSYKRRKLNDSTYTKTQTEQEKDNSPTGLNTLQSLECQNQPACKSSGIVYVESPTSNSNTDKNASSSTQTTEEAATQIVQPETTRKDVETVTTDIDNVTIPYLICSSALKLVSVERIPQMQVEPEHISPDVSQHQALSLNSITEVASTTCSVNKTKKAESGVQTDTKRKMATIPDENKIEYAQPLKVCKVTVKANKQTVESKPKKKAVMNKAIKVTTGMKTAAKRKIAAVNDEQEIGNTQPSKVRKVNDKPKKQAVVINPRVRVQRQCNVNKVVKNTQIAINQKPAKKAVSKNSKETQTIENVDTQMLEYTTENKEKMAELDWYEIQAVHGLMKLMKHRK